MFRGSLYGNRKKKGFGQFGIVPPPPIAESYTYIVDPVNGNDTNSGVDVDNAFATITKATSVVAAGETIGLRGGTYNCNSTGGIAPSISGTSGNPITYKAYEEEQPILTNGDVNANKSAINIINVNYIHVIGVYVDGLNEYTSSNTESWCKLWNAQYCVFDNCNFKYAKGWPGFEITNDAKYNIIRNCVFDFCGIWSDGNPTNPQDRGDALSLEQCEYNLIDSCTIKHSGHSQLVVQGRYNIVRNCLLDGDYTDVIGGTTAGVRQIECLDSGDGYFNPSTTLDETCKFNFFEDNIFQKPGAAVDNAENPGSKLQGYGNVMRFNIYRDSLNNGATIQINVNATSPRSNNCKVYHNVFYNNKGGMGEFQDLSSSVQNDDHSIFNNIAFDCRKDPLDGIGSSKDVDWRSQLNGPAETNSDSANNVFDNNCFYHSTRVDKKGYLYLVDVGNRDTIDNYDGTKGYVNNNLGENDPLFVNTTDFSLNVGSPCLNAGKRLAVSNGGGTGTVITVDDPYVFCKGISQLGVDGDEIIINGNTVKITDINHSASQITVNSSITWNNNDNIYLSRTGTSPNIGKAQ